MINVRFLRFIPTASLRPEKLQSVWLSGDAEEDTPAAERLCSAFKYSFCFVFLVVALLLVGAFVQFGHIPNSNGTVIDDLNFLGDQIKSKGLVNFDKFVDHFVYLVHLFEVK